MVWNQPDWVDLCYSNSAVPVRKQRPISGLVGEVRHSPLSVPLGPWQAEQFALESARARAAGISHTFHPGEQQSS